jgi:hypothetical protein
MPDQPLYKEFGKPMAESGTKLSDEIFNERYGTYQETGTWQKDGSRENGAAKHDPSPLTNIKK